MVPLSFQMSLSRASWDEFFIALLLQWGRTCADYVLHMSSPSDNNHNCRNTRESLPIHSIPLSFHSYSFFLKSVYIQRPRLYNRFRVKGFPKTFTVQPICSPYSHNSTWNRLNQSCHQYVTRNRPFWHDSALCTLESAPKNSFLRRISSKKKNDSRQIRQAVIAWNAVA